MKRTAYFSIVLFLSVMVSSCTEINETERAPTVERKIVETQASGKIVSRVTPIPSKPTNQTPRETSRVLPDYSGLNDPQVEQQFMSFEAQLDYWISNPKSVDEWVDMISLDSNSLFLPELPDCRGSKVRKCFDDLLPLIHLAMNADYAPGSLAKDIPPDNACTVMNYTYGIVKVYGEPKSAGYPEINSNFETMVRFDFIYEAELSDFRWAFQHRDDWDYLVHCVTPRETSRVLPDYSGLNDPQVEQQFMSFEAQLDYWISNPKSVDEWVDMISLDSNSLFLPELPDCRGSKVRKCFDDLLPLIHLAMNADYAPGSLAKDIPPDNACTVMNYTYGIVKVYGEPKSAGYPEINSNFETMVRFNFINEDELVNFRGAFHHRNHWDYSEYCL